MDASCLSVILQHQKNVDICNPEKPVLHDLTEHAAADRVPSPVEEGHRIAGGDAELRSNL